MGGVVDKPLEIKQLQDGSLAAEEKPTFNPLAPFRITNTGNDVVQISYYDWAENGCPLSYRKTGETDWTEFHGSVSEWTVVSVSPGEYVELRGNESEWPKLTWTDDGGSYMYLKSGSSIDLSGNIMSLIYGGDLTIENMLIMPEGQEYNRQGGVFGGLFDDFNSVNATAANLYMPATALTSNCYNHMFGGVHLLSAPVLPATTLVDGCYANIFSNQSDINSVTCLATNISASGCVDNWLYGVSSTGTFYKSPSMSSWAAGSSGIPANWTVQNYAG